METKKTSLYKLHQDSNAKFVDNAPDAVVAKEREKQEQITQALQSLQAKQDQLKAL